VPNEKQHGGNKRHGHHGQAGRPVGKGIESGEYDDDLGRALWSCPRARDRHRFRLL
jgi:hypothetical protein